MLSHVVEILLEREVAKNRIQGRRLCCNNPNHPNNIYIDAIKPDGDKCVSCASDWGPNRTCCAAGIWALRSQREAAWLSRAVRGVRGVAWRGVVRTVPRTRGGVRRVSCVGCAACRLQFAVCTGHGGHGAERAVRPSCEVRAARSACRAGVAVRSVRGVWRAGHSVRSAECALPFHRVQSGQRALLPRCAQSAGLGPRQGSVARRATHSSQR